MKFSRHTTKAISCYCELKTAFNNPRKKDKF